MSLSDSFIKTLGQTSLECQAGAKLVCASISITGYKGVSQLVTYQVAVLLEGLCAAHVTSILTSLLNAFTAAKVCFIIGAGK